MPPRKRKSDAKLSAEKHEAPKRTKNNTKKSKKRDPSPPSQPSSSPEPEPAPKSSVTAINWTLVHDGQELTHALLSEIEESDPHRQIFGFKTIGNAPPKATGDSAIAHCRSIAKHILIQHSSGKWKEDDLERLGTAVKNRVAFLKNEYRRIRDGLSETGAGLNSPEEILPNTELANIFDQIKAKFPYYWRMRDLNIGNPKLEPQLTVNGGTKLDVMAILGTNPSDLDEPEEQDSGHHSEPWGDVDAPSEPDPAAPPNPVKDEAAPLNPMATPKASASNSVRPGSTKKLSAVAEIAAGLGAERELRKSVAEVESKERTRRDQYKMDQRVEMERLRQEGENARQDRQHAFQAEQMAAMHQQQMALAEKNNELLKMVLGYAFGNRAPAFAAPGAAVFQNPGAVPFGGASGSGALPFDNMNFAPDDGPGDMDNALNPFGGEF